jgi:hypothetical protein
MSEAKSRERTRDVIIEHFLRYPEMQIVDFFKLLFHSAFGCEHAVSSLECAVEYIEREAKTAAPWYTLVERLDGDYCRVYIAPCLLHGVEARSLAEAFVSSARTEPEGRERLVEKLGVLRSLAEEGRLPVSPSALDSAVLEWESLGYTAVRHSDTYREHYHPAYRVILIAKARELGLLDE